MNSSEIGVNFLRRGSHFRGCGQFSCGLANVTQKLGGGAHILKVIYLCCDCCLGYIQIPMHLRVNIHFLCVYVIVNIELDNYFINIINYVVWLPLSYYTQLSCNTDILYWFFL